MFNHYTGMSGSICRAVMGVIKKNMGGKNMMAAASSARPDRAADSFTFVLQFDIFCFERYFTRLLHCRVVISNSIQTKPRVSVLLNNVMEKKSLICIEQFNS